MDQDQRLLILLTQDAAVEFRHCGADFFLPVAFDLFYKAVSSLGFFVSTSAWVKLLHQCHES